MTEFTYRVAIPGDEDKVLQFIREFYYPEETLTIGISPKGPTKADEEFSLSCIPTGLSIVAEDSNKNLVGVLLCYEVDNSTLPARKLKNAQEIDKKWKTILTFLYHLEEQVAICRRLNISKGIQFSVLGIDPAYRGKSIGLRLTQEASKNALEKGYQAVGAVCTSIYSVGTAEKLGMTYVTSVAFSDWKDEQGHVIFTPPPTRDRVKCYVKKLTKSDLIIPVQQQRSKL